jgi:hypothetical protein
LWWVEFCYKAINKTILLIVVWNFLIKFFIFTITTAATNSLSLLNLFDLSLLSIFYKKFYLKKQNQAACGTVNFVNNVKIVGGVVATQGSWPSIAFIIWRYKADYLLPSGQTYSYQTASACDGTLITTRKILTAGNHKFDIKNTQFRNYSL